MKKKNCIFFCIISCLFFILCPFMTACKITIEADPAEIVFPSENLPQLPTIDGTETEVVPPAQKPTNSNPPISGGSNDAGNSAGQSPSNSVTPSVQNDVYIRSLTNSLNLRKSPSTKAASVGLLDKNDMVLYISTENGWHKTVYKNAYAYVSANEKYTELYTLPRSDNSKIEKIITIGYTRLGYPYVYGAVRLHNGKGVLLSNFNDKEYDCSSLMQYIYYYGANILLDVTTRTQVVQGRHVSKENIQRGDLLFYTNGQRKNNVGVEKIGHVALYLGNNYILHTSSDQAVIEPMSKTRLSYFVEGRRFF